MYVCLVMHIKGDYWHFEWLLRLFGYTISQFIQRKLVGLMLSWALKNSQLRKAREDMVKANVEKRNQLSFLLSYDTSVVQ